MELRWISLLSSLAAIVYLSGWLIQQLGVLAARGKAWWLAHRKAGRIAAMKPAEKNNRRVRSSYGWDGNIGRVFRCI